MNSFGPILAAGILVGAAHAQDGKVPLSLRESVTMALENSAQMKVTEDAVATAEARATEARAPRYPQLNIQASYSRMGPLSSYEMSTGPYAPPVKMVFGVEDSYSGSLAFQYNLFDWGRIAGGVKTGDLGVEASQSSLSTQHQNTAYQVIQTFYGILVAHEVLRVNGETIALLEKNVAIARRRYDSGLASAYDLRSLEVQLGSARARRIEAENMLKKLHLTFNRLLGRPLPADVLLDGTLAYTPTSLDVDSLIRLGTARRPEAALAATQEEMARTQAEVTRTLDKPVFNLTATWGFRNGMFPNVNALRGNYVAGVSLAYPFFDGFRARSQVEQAEIAVRSAETRRRDIVPSIELEVRQAAADLLTAQEKLRVDEMKIAQAEEALSIAQERYTRGMLSTVELLDSQSALVNARLAYLQSVSNCIIGRYAINRAIGVPLP